MLQRTGSVYLDAPVRPSRIPTKPDRGVRGFLGSSAVVIGVVALTVAITITGLRMLLLDSEVAVNAFDQMLDDPIAREEFRAEMVAGIEDGLVGEELATIAAAFELDVSEEANRVSTLALEDEAVLAELRALVGEIHSRVLIAGDPSDVSFVPLTEAVLDVTEQHSPRLAEIVPADTTLWSLDGDSFPDLTGVADLSVRVRRYAVLAALLIPFGFAVHPRRHQMAAWAGRWILGVGLIAGIAAVAVPYVGGQLTGFISVEVAIRTISLKLLAPAALSGIIGIGLVSLAAVLRRRGERRVAEEGAAAMLAYDEPPFFQQHAGPTLDLSSRGLVDVNRPLTNI